jgi:AraC family transcriptional regulator, ethanolamine operon transcriptional activator
MIISPQPAGSGSSSAVEVVEIRDPTAAGGRIEVLAQDLVQLENEPLRARRIVVRLEDLFVVFLSTNLRVRTRTTLQEGLLAFTVLGPRARGTLNGQRMGPELMMVTGPGTTAELVVEGGYEGIALLVPPPVLESHLDARQREGRLCAPVGSAALDVNPDQLRGLFDWGKRLASVAARQPDVFSKWRATRLAAQAEAMELLLGVLDGSSSHRPTPAESVRQAHSRVVRKAQDYALERVGDRLYVKDLCLAAGVSERTLEYAFKELVGMTPVAYLTRLRLHRVRKALRAATPGSTTVSAEALNWGFWHFGEFSREYRKCFGELPSETLRRARG